MLLASACSLHPRKVNGSEEAVVTLGVPADLAARFDRLMMLNQAQAHARRGE